MKKTINVFLAVLLLLKLSSCDKPVNGEFEEPITVYEKIHGSWVLANLTLVDQIAKKNDIQPYEQNLSNLFNFDQFKIQLNVDEGFNPTTFEVSGDIPPIMATNGYWKLSYPFQPTTNDPLEIELYSDAAMQNMVDVLMLTSIPSGTDRMQVQLVRKSNDVSFLSYQFNLINE